MAPAGWKPSKYRVIEPTLAEDLVKHYPGMLRACLSFGSFRSMLQSAPVVLLGHAQLQDVRSCALVEKYSLPSEDQLEGLGEEDYARIVFVNREEAWVYVEYVDEADKVYGKLCDYMRSVDLHKNQRVWFNKDRIAEVKSGEDSDYE